MTEREKVIAAYVCSNEKLPDKRCEKCPYGYEYLDQTGDNYFVGCNTERIMVDAIDLLRAQLFDELSDVMWYIAEAAAAMGWSMDDIAEHNIEKLRRRYPEGFSADRSLHREG